MNAYKEINEKYYDPYLNKEGACALGWGSDASQLKRFEILLEIPGRKHDDSILDVGCGHGDLSKFCSNYTGIDCRKSVIDVAKSRYSNKKFYHCSISDIVDKYDWVMASGIFAIDHDWKQYVTNELTAMFLTARKGVACNFLSSNEKRIKNPAMKYASIGEICDIVQNISEKFTVRHDYFNNDVTVYLYHLQ